MELTRRDLLKDAALAGAGFAALGMAAAPAQAEITQAAAGIITADALDADHPYLGYGEAKPDFFNAPEPIAADQITETLECEVLVLGAGLAGCSCACAAAQGGAKVIVAEKMPVVSERGAGAGTINSSFAQQFEDGVVEDVTAAEFRWMQTCGNRSNEALVAQFMTRSGEAGDWLVEDGKKHNCNMGIWDGYSRCSYLPDEPGYITMSGGEGNDLTLPGGSFVAADVLHLEAIAAGAEFLFCTPAVQLVQGEDGVVTGAILMNEDDEYIQVNASKGVVVATGDIGGNEDMCRYYCPVCLDLPSVYTPVGGNNGDGHRMMLWAGAQMQEAPFPTAMHPQRWADAQSNQLEGPFLYVNEKGERFFNEGTWVQARSLQILQNTADDCAWSIFDSSWPEDLEASLPYGGMFWDMFRYNEQCANGVDVDFCKNPALLFPIEEGPFYASKVGAVILAVVGGALINTDFQVLDEAGEPIQGLHAVGNASGGAYAVDYPINVPGNSHGRALTQGYLCGRKLAGVE